jgi:hypothetical protein
MCGVAPITRKMCVGNGVTKEAAEAAINLQFNTSTSSEAERVQCELDQSLACPNNGGDNTYCVPGNSAYCQFKNSAPINLYACGTDADCGDDGLRSVALITCCSFFSDKGSCNNTENTTAKLRQYSQCSDDADNCLSPAAIVIPVATTPVGTTPVVTTPIPTGAASVFHISVIAPLLMALVVFFSG